MTMAVTWSGRWVADALTVSLRTLDTPIGVDLDALVGLALRRNPRRAHLLVSTVLGKHVPADPDLVYGSGRLLGVLVAAVLHGIPRPCDLTGGGLVTRALAGEQGAARALVAHVDARRDATAAAGRHLPPGTVVLGYAETATAVGQAVADSLEVDYLHSTRRRVADLDPLCVFEEEHSHATSHLLLPEDREMFAGTGPLVLVDDELSTGTTVLNTLAALHVDTPRTHYVIAALVDLRSGSDRERMARFAERLGVRLDVVSLAAGEIDLPDEFLTRALQLVDIVATASGPAVADRVGAAPEEPATEPPRVVHLEDAWPVGLREGGRHGFTPADRAGLEVAVEAVAASLALPCARDLRVHVLGFEELMYAPLRLAQALGRHLGDSARVTFSTTTRSPTLPVDEVTYAIRTRLEFPSHDDPLDGPGTRYAYNVTAPPTDPAAAFDTVVLVVDSVGDRPELHAPGGLLDVLSGAARQVVLVVVPALRPFLVAAP